MAGQNLPHLEPRPRYIDTEDLMLIVTVDREGMVAIKAALGLPVEAVQSMLRQIGARADNLGGLPGTDPN